MLLNPQEVKKVKSALSEAEKIVIIPHKNPDGDAVGSCFALKILLNDLGMNAEIVSPNDIPIFLKFLPGINDFINAEKELDFAQEKISEADILFLLDFNDAARIDQLEKCVKFSKALKILIDHHQQPQTFDMMFSRPDLPATCELIYHFIKALGWQENITPEIATYLMTGILTDTGNFRYSSVKQSTFQAAGELTALGANAYQIQDKILDNVSPRRYALLSVFLQNMLYLPELRTSIFTMSREELKRNNFEKGDTDGFVNYGLSIANNVLSIYLSEDTQKDMVKISFRSKNTFDVSEFTRNHFEGGGHVNAAGGKSDLSLEETKEKILRLLENYKDELQAVEL
ncbi:Bifunctional oligoribonuclease and PAP phosphatase nrnA [Candidatus Ornithobacterium hominis]|uniref:Bifunctional oligoribonuclease and PAP phosphatase nrnA n=1 Tax=Candidatus Ornithobacterium hominis TaxID=2497989 RepID=A0A383TZ75_9FLAO|nr:bifunctional oligoribonuclease/PAP phosphatase NrnA [Candidatus Ornithobacterium hominis]MCT7903933.1 bifunctional oligoribonuclease/PAP phosphatase NrnA [Candidatus Ornithobacterium hominis]SZD72530.1 Bifunctional oligoribonuclease and PAP phosphatase nrnA [Candidatus Ornithobacterium hominis]